MIDAFITPTSRLSVGERKYLADHLTRSGSVFQRELLAGALFGTICLALERGEIVGWARTAEWENWPTLEAFVGSEHRRRGVATFCAAGLVASGLYRHSSGYCAVFRPSMKALTKKVGLFGVLFDKDSGGWRVTWQ